MLRPLRLVSGVPSECNAPPGLEVGEGSGRRTEWTPRLLHPALALCRPAHSAQLHHEGAGATSAHRTARALRHHYLCHHRTRAVPRTDAQNVLLPGIWSANLPLPGQDMPPPLAPRPHPLLKETPIRNASPTGSSSTSDKRALSVHSRLRPQSQITATPLASNSALSQASTLQSRTPAPALKTPSSRTGPIYTALSSGPQPKPCFHPLFKSPSKIHKTLPSG